MTTSDLFPQALHLHQSGDLQQAEMLYRRILQIDPNHADALHLLGVIAHQVGQHEAAVHYIRMALQWIPNFAPAYNNLGNALKGLGKLAEAADSYREAVRLKPDYVEAYSNLGIALRAQGQLETAAAIYRQALRLQPNSAMVHNNLGNVLRDQEKLTEAAACYEQALRLEPGYAEAMNNLGIALQEQGKTQQAVAWFREALRLRPDYADGFNNLGVILAGQGQAAEARSCYEQALRIRPDYADARKNLGLLLHSEGKLEEAAAQFQEVLKVSPDEPTARHLVAALTGATTPTHSAPDYVAALFDGYAGHFDEHLVKVLHYRGHELLKEALKGLGSPKAMDILDLGCGTGLCGVILRDWARTLTGVDLSAKMLAKARERKLYDKLIHGDVLVPLQTAEPAFDLIVAADVFDYVGDLSAVFQAASKALRPGGHLAFWVEAYEGEGASYVLLPSGRFAHTVAYLRGLAGANEFEEVSMTKGVARTDRGKNIDSHVVVLRRIR